MAYKNSQSLKRLNTRLNALIPSHQNTAMVLSSLLNLSKEAIYRRLRGDTPFSLEELTLLRKEFGLSIDELAGASEVISFSLLPLYYQPLELKNYLQEIVTRLEKITTTERYWIYNLCDDLPFFRQFGYPTLARFKLYYWNHVILNNKSDNLSQFSYDSIPNEFLELTTQIYNLYTRLSSSEIWTRHTIQNTLHQIDYLDDCGLFENQELLFDVYSNLITLIADLIRDASCNLKQNIINQTEGDFNLHICGLSLDNNSVYLENTEPIYLAIGFNSFNSLQTKNKRVLLEYRNWLNVILSKSTTISGQAERIRHQFHKEIVASILQSAQQRIPHEKVDKLVQLANSGNLKVVLI